MLLEAGDSHRWMYTTIGGVLRGGGGDDSLCHSVTVDGVYRVCRHGHLLRPGQHAARVTLLRSYGSTAGAWLRSIKAHAIVNMYGERSISGLYSTMETVCSTSVSKTDSRIVPSGQGCTLRLYETTQTAWIWTCMPSDLWTPRT